MAEAAQKAVERAYFSFRDIDGLVVVSSSGIATPSLDAPLMERLNRDENQTFSTVRCAAKPLARNQPSAATA